MREERKGGKRTQTRKLLGTKTELNPVLQINLLRLREGRLSINKQSKMIVQHWLHRRSIQVSDECRFFLFLDKTTFFRFPGSRPPPPLHPRVNTLRQAILLVSPNKRYQESIVIETHLTVSDKLILFSLTQYHDQLPNAWVIAKRNERGLRVPIWPNLTKLEDYFDKYSWPCSIRHCFLKCYCQYESYQPMLSEKWELTK